MHGGHIKLERSPQEQNGKQATPRMGIRRTRRSRRSPILSKFPSSYCVWFSGVGYTCEPTGVNCPGWFKTANNCHTMSGWSFCSSKTRKWQKKSICEIVFYVVKNDEQNNWQRRCYRDLKLNFWSLPSCLLIIWCANNPMVSPALTPDKNKEDEFKTVHFGSLQ